MKKKAQLKILEAARLKFIALSKARKFWQALSALCEGVSPEYRAAVIERLRQYTSEKPERRPVVESVAKVLRP